MKTYSRKKAGECQEVIIDLNELCRLCMAKEDELVPIFNGDDPVPLTLRIMACVALEVRISSELHYYTITRNAGIYRSINVNAGRNANSYRNFLVMYLIISCYSLPSSCLVKTKNKRTSNQIPIWIKSIKCMKYIHGNTTVIRSYVTNITICLSNEANNQHCQLN